MSDWIIFESLFVFAVWMQRKHRWAIFGQAMSGKYTVAGSVRAGSQAFQYTSANDGTVQQAAGGSGGSGGSNNPNIPGTQNPLPFPSQSPNSPWNNTYAPPAGPPNYGGSPPPGNLPEPNPSSGPPGQPGLT